MLIYNVLTPNNFLLGYKSCDINIRDGLRTHQIDYWQKWKQVQNIANMYWNRWLRVYTQISNMLEMGTTNQKL